MMTMKIHKNSTSCNCVGGASSSGGCGGGCGIPMICYPLYEENCGCGGGCGNGSGSWSGGSVGGGTAATYPTGAAAYGGAQCLECGCPVVFGGLTYNYGNVVAHSVGSTDFVITVGGNYRVCWNVTVQKNDCGCGDDMVGNTYGFAINGLEDCTGSATEGTEGFDGTVSKCCVLTLVPGEILRLVPTSGCNATIVSATLELTQVPTPMPL